MDLFFFTESPTDLNDTQLGPYVIATGTKVSTETRVRALPPSAIAGTKADLSIYRVFTPLPTYFIHVFIIQSQQMRKI